MLLFLGAGASKFFGMPDMRELTDIVITELKNRYDRDVKVIHAIQKRIETFKMKPDIEAILSCIDALSDPKKGIRNAGPFAAYISRFPDLHKFLSGYKTYTKGKDFKAIAKEIREIIREKCFLPPTTKEKNLVKTYDMFFDILDINNHKSLFIFTTNYDCCFEVYCREKRYNLVDNFSDRGGKKVFDIENRPSGNWELYKLHGSSNYMITNKDELIKTETLLKPGDRTSIVGEVIKEAMIYPTSEKYFSKSPYIDLLNYLRDDLHNLANHKRGYKGPCIVVGYSFRDLPINNAFIDAYEKKGFLEDIKYIDPNASKTVKKNIPELKHIIKSIDKKFEEITELDLFLEFFKNE